MQIEEQRMRVIRDGGIVDNDYQEDLLAQADNLDRPRAAHICNVCSGASPISSVIVGVESAEHTRFYWSLERK
jgi:hypothetical protein